MIADPAFDTPLTRRFNLRLPVIAGGLMWLSDADYVAAGARAGILSFLTAASFPDPDALKAEIARCRTLAQGRPFGVNVSMRPKPDAADSTADTLRLIADAGITVVETSGRSPEPYLAILKDAGITVIHKVPSVRYALKAQSLGVDMVTIVGAECGGHPGMDLVGSMVNLALAERQLTIPFLIGGGIGAGSQIVAALASGAAGVTIGTRLLAAQEINAHPDYKSALVQASERDTTLTMASVRNTIRTLKNETTQIVARLEAENPDGGIDRLMPHVAGHVGRHAYATGDTSRGLLSAGQSLGLLDATAPLADIVARLEQEALTALNRLRPIPRQETGT